MSCIAYSLCQTYNVIDREIKLIVKFGMTSEHDGYRYEWDLQHGIQLVANDEPIDLPQAFGTIEWNSSGCPIGKQGGLGSAFVELYRDEGSAFSGDPDGYLIKDGTLIPGNANDLQEVGYLALKVWVGRMTESLIKNFNTKLTCSMYIPQLGQTLSGSLLSEENPEEEDPNAQHLFFQDGWWDMTYNGQQVYGVLFIAKEDAHIIKDFRFHFRAAQPMDEETPREPSS